VALPLQGHCRCKCQ